MVVVVAVGGGGGTGSSSDQAEKATPAVGIGEETKVGDAEWIVTNARYVKTLTSDLGDTKKGNFVVVDFNFTNGAKESVTLDSASLTLVDDQGRKSEADTDTLGYVDPAKDIFLNQVNPGVTQPGEIIYSVAPDAKGFTLKLSDVDMFSDESADVKLGF